jgi:protease I
MVMAKSKEIAIMVAEQYQVTEVWYPYYRLKEAGFECDFVAADANREYPSREGYPCRSTVAAKDAKIDDYACMVVPGGFAPDFMRRSDDIIKFANDMVNANKIIAAALWRFATISKTPAQNTSMRNVLLMAT